MKHLKMLSKVMLAGLLLVSLSATSFAGGDASLEKAINGKHRSDKNKARDKYRKPMETLKFFGVKPNMTVVEIAPGGGWYSEILAPYLKAKGTFVAAHAPKEPEGKYADYYKKARAKYIEKMEPYGKYMLTEFAPPKYMEVAKPGSADMVLTFRNVHNWMPDEKAAFEAFFKALKPGGVLGVVEHRANESDEGPAQGGYVKQSHVVAMAKAAGFKLAAKSELLSNPKDTKNYEKGVWTLPPSLNHDKKDRDKYLAIGESDRMLLRFVKP